MEKRIDRRIIKSKRAIRGAFFELLTEKDFKSITIKEISERAQVDRKTFYNYYSSIFALVNEFENELIVSLDALFDEIDFSKFSENPEEIFTSLYKFLKPNLEYYKLMFSINFSENLSSKIIGLLKFKIIASFEKGLIAKKMDPQQFDLQVISEFLSSAILGVYFRWIDEGSARPFENLTKDIGEITLYGLNGYLIKKPDYSNER
jgi:AcrR family transcriptional regulator